MAKLKSVAKEMAENWIVPTCVVAFLANTLRSKQAGRVIPWRDFRIVLSDIIKDRIS